MTWRDLSRRVDRLEPEHGDVSAWVDRFIDEQAAADREDPGTDGVLVAVAENEHYRIEVAADPEDVPDWIDIAEDLPVSLD
jgi:hypothetical protein